ncbi:MAG TPA: sulfite exporter TauE/SafE family protein [Planctomycetaceae bacterium]
MDLSNSSLFWLCLSALAAGAVNSLAGGGTLLTFPALTAALAAHGPNEAKVWANATSTVALVPGALAGAWGYRREIAPVRRWLAILAVPSLIGGVIGSLLLTRLDPRYFAVLVPWLLLAAAVVFLLDTLLGRYRTTRPESRSLATISGLVVFQFAVGVYGGYFGAGIGIMMLSALALMGVGDIHRMNSLKTLLNACINGVSVAIFVHDGKVEWKYAAPMALASIVGGYLGARLALRVKPRVVRWMVISIGFGLAMYYFQR